MLFNVNDLYPLIANEHIVACSIEKEHFTGNFLSSDFGMHTWMTFKNIEIKSMLRHGAL